MKVTPHSPIIFFIHLVQDVELLVPLMARLQAGGQAVLALLHYEAAGRYPTIAYRLKESRLPWSIFDERRSLEWFSALRGARAVVTATDTNVSAHRRGRRFVKYARLLLVPTFTLQHGLENIGLNYSDDEFPAESVRFASKYVLTWGGRSDLHPRASFWTKRKVRSVGILRDVGGALRERVSNHQIAVFENLHWSRYSPAYQKTFLESLIRVAEDFPEIRFILKPHTAGRWTMRNLEDSRCPNNLKRLDPNNPGHPLAQNLIEESGLVITTPSTIALDAALAGCPVAVFGHDLQLDRYEPLPILREVSDWFGVIDKVSKGTFPLASVKKFVERNSVGRAGFDRASEFIMAHS